MDFNETFREIGFLYNKKLLLIFFFRFDLRRFFGLRTLEELVFYRRKNKLIESELKLNDSFAFVR